MISIKGLDKAEVLKALYDGSHVQGLGFLQAVDSFTVDDARELLKTQTHFDYLYGRVMKVDLSKDEFDEWLYDRDNYPGAAQIVIKKLREEKYSKAIEILEWKKNMLLSVPEHLIPLMDEKTSGYEHKLIIDALDVAIESIKLRNDPEYNADK